MFRGDVTHTRDDRELMGRGQSIDEGGTMTDVAPVDAAPDASVRDAAVQEALFHAAGSAAEPVFVVGGDPLRVLWANRAFADAMCAEVVDLDGVPVESVLRAVTGALPLNDVRVSRFRATLTPRLGFATSWDAACFPSTGPGGASWVVSLRRSGDVDNADQLLSAAEERFRALSERAPIGIFTSEVGLRWGYVNDWLARLVSLPADRLLGTGWTEVVDPDHMEAVSTCLLNALAGAAGEAPARLVAADGRERWVTIRAVPIHAPDSPAAFLGTVEDVTERRVFEELLSWQATHDPLTRLPNRTRLQREVEDALRGDRSGLAVLFLDLDEFKVVNDSMGHAAGDELLIEVASRLRELVHGDRVFRFAGDEFIVVLRDCADHDAALALGEALCRRIAEPMVLPSSSTIGTVSVSCSLGVSFADVSSTVEQLVHDADLAMYRAKRRNKEAR